MQAIFEVNRMPIQIRFRCPKLLKFHGKLNSNHYPFNANKDGHVLGNMTSDALDKCLKHEYDEENFIVKFIVQLPSEGQYGIDIYARDPDYQTEKRTMSHCCKYILNCTESSVRNSNTNSHHWPHDYSFDQRNSNEQITKMSTSRVHSALNKNDVNHSARK
jgi:hypothetical protein